ncbi:MBL fold metallo-hydrolase [Mergibacter septicus]|uniref:MBL fold metallo-hydrolase n=1 Tax=Mergibacter septicus TaxID=221402 RepID=UPI00117904C8|nr:MBL fold metallo-hydrolase [Mergibacter septicus]AWX13714.1 MBL fold metallo-hydrolase [Mergibacter septicus]
MKFKLIPVTPFQQNCSIMWDTTGNAAIIDPGGEADKIIQFIQQNDLTPQAILLTHGHLDHVGAAVTLKKQYGIDIIGPHQADEYWLTGLPQQAQHFGLPDCSAFTPDQWLNENDEVQIGSLHFKVLHLPGHTPGHIGFINQENNIAFTGDVLFNGGIGRTDFPGGSYSQLILSIKEKLLPLDEQTQIIAGHGPTTTIGNEKYTNPFLLKEHN